MTDIEVRMYCLERAIECYKSSTNGLDNILNYAKTIEKFINSGIIEMEPKND